MPELPEVETIRISLEKKLPRLKITGIDVLNPKSFQSAGRRTKLLKGKKVLNIFRRAKILGINLEDNLTLLIHLKMSGQLILQGNKGHPTQDMTLAMPNKSTRVIFEFENCTSSSLSLRADGLNPVTYTLYFNDQRKFGWIKLVKSDEFRLQSFWKNLGPEPLEKSFTSKVLKKRLERRKNTPIKVAIMDQQIISGVGNIYASEACFLAKIDPSTKIKDLRGEQYKKLYQGIIKSLEHGIKYGGSTRTHFGSKLAKETSFHFVDPEGKKGTFLDFANVYNKRSLLEPLAHNKAGKPCRTCKTPIQKITLAGRGTFYCLHCQSG